MDVISFSEAATANSRIEIINANPDSTSGIVTVPKTIASGETVTIPAGRVAVLPNLVIDGVLNIENGGEVFIPSGATLGDLDAQLALKAPLASPAFTGTPIAPTQTAGDSSTKLATTAFCTSQDIGVGQTVQNVVGSRGYNQIYTNSTGKPIFVMLAITTLAGTAASLQIETSPSSGIYEFVASDTGSANISTNLVGIVPNLCRYKVVTVNTPNLQFWKELR